MQVGLKDFGGEQFCVPCREVVKSAAERFRAAAEAHLARGWPEGPAWDGLIAQLERDRVPTAYAIQSIQRVAIQSLERFVDFAHADLEITEEELAAFDMYAARLSAPDSKAMKIRRGAARGARLLGLRPGFTDEKLTKLRQRMARAAALSRIRRGSLPTADAGGIYLEIDESCHLNSGATYLRQMRTGLQELPGQLLITSKKFRFLSPAGGWELAWPKIMSVGHDLRYTIHVRASQKKGTGAYRVADPEYAAAVIETVARMNKRQIVTAHGERDTRRIPQDVKAAVWQRDGGRCVECGAGSYLEFDHVIPLSKGGATSVGNLQLLCRACNIRKRDRI